ncbi:MAG: flavodoxin domain-containing protein [Candidatus Latescibacterota bacterium]|jgi:sulfite reductase (NADPH) flavoprotein alpha-component
MISETNSPFTAGQAAALNALLGELTPSQGVWLSGYLAGTAAAREQAGPAGPDPGPAGGPAVDGTPRVAVVYATETGNSRRLATQLAGRIEALGWRPAMFNAAELQPRKLEHEEVALFIASTHGEGDPPEPARPFVRALHGRRPPKLTGLRYSVLGLGDTSYRRFCQAARDLDERLEALGGQRLHPRQDCDVDYAAAAEAWMAGVLGELGQRQTRVQPVVAAAAGGSAAGLEYGRERPFAAEVLENVLLTDIGSTKATRHLELSLEGSGLTYCPGDALGVFPTNGPEEAAAVIGLLGLDPAQPVTVRPGAERPLQEALERDLELSRLTPPVVAQYARTAGDALRELTGPEQEARLWEYLGGRGVRDLVTDFPPQQPLSGQELVELLRRMPPRLYSVASSLQAHPDEVHLTVAEAWFAGPAGERLGVFSRQCGERAEPGAVLPVFVQANPEFRLPEDGSVPLVLVGAGSGVAPFRAFLEEREEVGATGRTWLVFGERCSRTDFLYQAEWLQRLQRGTLSRMDVAFSRDTGRKVYVQDRLKARAADLFAWLEEGAWIYVCGDERRMAPAVHTALIDVVQEQGGRSREAAAAYLDDLVAAGRYRRDVY